MNTRPVKQKEYFAKLLDIPVEEIDYSDIPPTTAADWQNVEVLLPITVEEFKAIKKFVRRRHALSADAGSC
jgi:hypothetical protein